MSFSAFSRGAVILCAAAFCLQATAQVDQTYARDAKQAIDQDYTQRITKYTTLPELNSPLTDYLPASSTVPTPAKVLGDVSGAPDILALCRRSLSLLPPAGISQPARKGRHHRPFRRGPRDDRCRRGR